MGSIPVAGAKKQLETTSGFKLFFRFLHRMVPRHFARKIAEDNRYNTARVWVLIPATQIHLWFQTVFSISPPNGTPPICLPKKDSKIA